MTSSQRQISIEKNLRFFREHLDVLIKTDPGRYVLLRNEEIAGVYDTIRDAKLTGEKFFDDGDYSIQQITKKPVNLGFFSYAGSALTAQ